MLAAAGAFLRSSCWREHHLSGHPIQDPAASSCSFASSFVASVAASVASLDCSPAGAHLAGSFVACAATSFASTFAFAARGLARRRHRKASCPAQAVAAAVVTAMKPSFGGMDRSCFSFRPALAEAGIRSC